MDSMEKLNGPDRNLYIEFTGNTRCRQIQTCRIPTRQIKLIEWAIFLNERKLIASG